MKLSVSILLVLNLLFASDMLENGKSERKKSLRQKIEHSAEDLELYTTLSSESGIFVDLEYHPKEELEIIFFQEIFRREEENIRNRNNHRSNFAVSHVLSESWEGSWVGNSQTFNSYDENQNLNYILYQNYDTGYGTWYNSVQSFREYDENNNWIFEINQTYDQNSDEWWTSRNIELEYDVNNNATQYRYIYFNQDGSFNYAYQYNYEYDEDGNTTFFTYGNYDLETQNFSPTYQAFNTLENGNIVTYLSQNFDGNMWMDNYGYDAEYDENGLQLSITYSGAWQTGSYAPYATLVYTYDDNLNLVLSEEFNIVSTADWGAEFSGYNENETYSVGVILIDDFGDGHGCSSYIVDNEGNQLHELPSYQGYEEIFGPFDLEAGLYGIYWPECNYLEEQSFEVYYYETGVDFGTGNYINGSSSCFALGSDSEGEQYVCSEEVTLELTPTWLNTYTYDENNNMISRLRQWYESGDGIWNDNTLYEYGYDDNGNQILYLRSYWDLSDWTYEYRRTREFDDNSNEIFYLTEYYNDGVGWENNTRIFTDWINLDLPFISIMDDVIINEDEEMVINVPTNSTDLTQSYADNDNVFLAFEDNFMTITTTQNWNGESIITVVVSNDNGSFEREFLLTVLPVDDDPYMLYPPADMTTEEDTPVSINIQAIDPEGDYFNLSADSFCFPDVEAYTFSNGDSLMLVPSPNWNGDCYIYIELYNENIYLNYSFTLTVTPVDDEPFTLNYIQDQYFYEDFQEPWIRNLDSVFIDIDDELDLVYSVVLSEGGIVSAEIIEDSILTLQAIPDGEGDDTLFVTASNPTRASVTDTVLITVFAENDAPVVADMEPLVMTEDTPYEFMSMASLVEVGHISDVDNTLEELTFHLHSETEQIHVEWDGDASSNPVVHTEPDYYGTGSLTLCVADGYEETCTTIGLNVDPVNDAPYFASEMHAPVGVDMEFHLPLEVIDVDSETLVLTLTEDGVNPEWVMLTDHTLHGTPDEMGEYAVYLSLSDGQATVLDTFYLHVVNFKPEIIAIEDIPNDQGGRVYVGFNPSFMDNGVETGQSYSVFRWDVHGENESWVLVQSGDAVGHPSYIYEVSTLTDSSNHGDGVTSFMVVANMNNGIFHSDPMMGYSVDNIAPGVPGGLLAMGMDESVHLNWDISSDEDFQYFVLEKAANVDFSDSELIETSDTSYTDVNITANQSNYYRLVAVDYAGNTSDYSEVVEATVLSIDENMLPEVFTLHQNYPNPFNPTTQIKYDLPEDSFVSIAIYDVMGRNIRNLMNVNQAAGYHSIRWDAKNDIGEGVAAGMYIYTIQAGEFRATKKMVLLK